MKHNSPQLGFNNNVRHKGRVFHIQTEDSGIKHPHIITHLFADGGRILKSTKTSYAEFLGEEELSKKIRSLMQEQHKAMFIALRGGKFDHLFGDQPAPADAAPASTVGPASSVAPASEIQPNSLAAATSVARGAAPASEPAASAPAASSAPVASSARAPMPSLASATEFARESTSSSEGDGPPTVSDPAAPPAMAPIEAAAPRAVVITAPGNVAVSGTAMTQQVTPIPDRRPRDDAPASSSPAPLLPNKLGGARSAMGGEPSSPPNMLGGAPAPNKPGLTPPSRAPSPAGAGPQSTAPASPLRGLSTRMPPVAEPAPLRSSSAPASAPASTRPKGESSRPNSAPATPSSAPAKRPSAAPRPPSIRPPMQSNLDLDLEALERAAEQNSPSNYNQIRDLPPPPATLLRPVVPARNAAPATTTSYRSVTPQATQIVNEKGAAAQSRQAPPARGSSPGGVPRSGSQPGRYAPSRPSSIFGNSRPQEGSSIFGEDLISEKSLDEVILSYLAEDLEGPNGKK